MLKGIDISKWQTSTPSLAGLSFVALRASIAMTKDSMYTTHYANARKAGVMVMAYHYGYPATSASGPAPIADQAKLFLTVAKDADYLWLDQEEAGFDDAQAQQFIDAVRAAGRPCGLYHSASGFGGVTADAQWVADWRSAAVTAGHPLKADASGEFPGWDLWQYNGGGGDGIDNDYLNPATSLASLLRQGWVVRTAYDALEALMQAKIDNLDADLARAQDDLDAAAVKIDALTATTVTQQGTIDADQAALAKAAADLAAAPGTERERIALVLGQAEADRVRATA